MLEEEFKDKLIVEWRAFMLRPEPGKRRLEDFRTYTKNWQHVASEPDSGQFRTWSTDEGPPSHSMPPHLVAKAAARVGPDSFERIHSDLLQIWDDAGLSSSQFEAVEDPDLRVQVIDEHNEAINCGATGAPAFRTSDNDMALTGAHPMQLFRRWINRALDRISEG